MDFASQNSVSLPLSQSLPTFPAVSAFRTVTTSHCKVMPKISEAKIQQYIVYRQAAGQEASSNTSAMKKGKQLADQSVEALSLSEAVDKSKIFFSGMVCTKTCEEGQVQCESSCAARQ